MTVACRLRVLAVASAGGHFNQLLLLRSGLDGHTVTYLTTMHGLAETHGAGPSAHLPDCSADTPFRILLCLVVTGWRVLRHWPHAIVTTGALPGVIALFWGRVIGARTLWIDSIANAEEMSRSGRLARRIAHRTLSQWPGVAEAECVEYHGALL